MNIQIFGTKKNFDSKKAERYFKERGIKYQFIDMKEKGLSKGEFQSVCQAIGRENPRKPEHHQSPCGKKRKTGDSRISAGDLEELEVIVIAFYKLSDFTILYRRK